MEYNRAGSPEILVVFSEKCGYPTIKDEHGPCDIASLRRGQLAVIMLGQGRSDLDRVSRRRANPLRA
jgi:hypothetical protein